MNKTEFNKVPGLFKSLGFCIEYCLKSCCFKDDLHSPQNGERLENSNCHSVLNETFDWPRRTHVADRLLPRACAEMQVCLIQKRAITPTEQGLRQWACANRPAHASQ